MPQHDRDYLDDKLGAFSGDDGAEQDDSVKSSLDLLNTDTDTIITDVKHLTRTATAAVDMTTEVVDASVISRILSKTSDTSTFTPVTDSMEMISDKIGAYAGTSRAGATESVKAELDLIKVRTDLLRGTVTGVIVEDGATGLASITWLISHANANSFGVWVVIDASTSAISYICSVTVAPAAVWLGTGYVLEIGTGTEGNEVTKIRYSFRPYVKTDAGFGLPIVFTLPIPIQVAASTRITGRIARGTDGAATHYCSLQMYQSLE